VPEQTSAASLPAELAEALRSGGFHDALRLAIDHSGLTLTRVRAHLEQRGLSVGESTLSYWQRGARQPSLPQATETVRALESVLRLPRDSLVALAGQRGQRGGREFEVPAFADLRAPWGVAADALLTELGPFPTPNRVNADLDRLFQHDTISYDAERRQRCVHIRLAVRARTHGPDRLVEVSAMDDGSRIEDVRLVAFEGCRVGRVRRDSEQEMLVAELLFDRRLAEGEVHVLCFEVRSGPGSESPGYYRVLRGPVPSYLLQLKFSRRSLPVRCVRHYRATGDSAPIESDDLACDTTGMTSAYFHDVGPGWAGVALEWS